MALSIVGTDGNPFTGRDLDGSPSNFIYTLHKIIPSGSYSTGGDTLDLTQITGQIPSGAVPIEVDVVGQGNPAGTSWTAIGNYFAVLLGAALNSYKLKFFVAAGTELSAGAYPATATNDTILAKITWRKLI